MTIQELADPLRPPKYVAVATHLKDEITKGTYGVGEYLPSEHKLGELYGVSRPTIRAAVAKLRDMGLLEVIHGIGTRVISKHIYQELPNHPSFTDVITSQGLDPGTRVLDIEATQASQDVAAKLRIEVGSPVNRVARLRLADGSIIGFFETYLPANITIDGPRLQELTSLYRYLETEHGISISFTDETIWAQSAPPKIARLLEIKTGEAVLVMDSVGHSLDNQIVEVSKSYVRSDRLQYKVRVHRKGTAL